MIYCGIQCPICLHPPIAAKVGRCGHAHCASCVLKLLSICEHPECPVCQCALTASDLRSVICGVERRPKSNSSITFVKMRRDKNRIVPVPQSETTQNVSPLLFSATPVLKFVDCSGSIGMNVSSLSHVLHSLKTFSIARRPNSAANWRSVNRPKFHLSSKRKHFYKLDAQISSPWQQQRRWQQ